MPLVRSARGPALFVAILALFEACGGSTPTETGSRAPLIAVSGITDGAQFSGPVTISITIDIGTYRADLNGASFISGRTVSNPGAYTLVVNATNGSATATATIRFSIVLAGESFLIVRMFDLGDNDAGGGGDAILLTDSSANGQRHVLIDAGPAGNGGADPAFVSRELTALGVDTLEHLILSHGHSDHYAGMGAVLQSTVVRQFVYNGQVRNLSSYTTLVANAVVSALAVTTPVSVSTTPFGLGMTPSQMVIIPAIPTDLANANAGSSELNDGSIGVLVSKGSFTMFFAGDGEVNANQRWRTQFAALTGNITALKLGHHGANDAMFDNGFSGASAWLTHTNPGLAVASANGTTHPRINATNLLLTRTTTTTRCTNVHGDIVIRVSDSGIYAVSVGTSGNALCAPGVNASTF